MYIHIWEDGIGEVLRYEVRTIYNVFFLGGGLDFHEVCSGSGGVQFLHLGLAISFA